MNSTPFVRQYGIPVSYTHLAAIGYTEVPHTLGALCRQRIRWARGMFDGLRAVAPWGQRSFFGGYFESLNLSIIFLDVAFIFGFWAGVVLLCLGRDWLVGCCLLYTSRCV